MQITLLSNHATTFVFIDGHILLSSAVAEKLGNTQQYLSLADLAPLPDCLNEHQQQAVTIQATEDMPAQTIIDLHFVDYPDNEFSLLSLREALLYMCANEFQPLARAWQYARFLRTHRYCGRCGEQNRRISWEVAMHCDKCSHRVYPRVSPCIIVAIHNNEQILLAQGPQQAERGFFSTLAGFVESAESLEQAVHREVMEEVGVKLKSLEYFGSQAWPFPHSLMVGYIAEYDSGDITVDGKEILQADWFSPDQLPVTSSTKSIAGRLIEETCRRIAQSSEN